MPGHHDAGNEYTSIEDAQTAALFAKEQGLGGKYSPFDIPENALLCPNTFPIAPDQTSKLPLFFYQTLFHKVC